MAGALYNPVRDEMFTAIRGGGAFLNGERLAGQRADRRGADGDRHRAADQSASTASRATTRGWSGSADRIGAIRIVGSSANSCAHVACGRLTGYFEESGLVDWAVGVLLVEEAGGVVTDWWGRGPEVYEKTGMVIVANAATHAFLIEMLKDAPRKELR